MWQGMGLRKQIIKELWKIIESNIWPDYYYNNNNKKKNQNTTKKRWQFFEKDKCMFLAKTTGSEE